MRHAVASSVEAFPRKREIPLDWFQTGPADRRADAEEKHTEPVPTVFVVDSDDATRKVVQDLAEKMGFVARTCAHGRSLFECLVTEPLGCVVMEVRLPEMGGVLVQQRLREAGYSIPVVYLTAFGSIPLAVRAVQDGAVGFFEKPFREQELWDAILRGVEVHRQRRAVARRKRHVTDRLVRLNADERKVLDLVLNGNSNRPIAEMLDLSVRTIELRRASVMRKLEVETLPELFRFMCDAVEHDCK
jgi:FixJ family two-component response regulator